ncbi:hypothetical protein [Streptomyces sp. NPDC093094]|uniref:hypothetical protein n=1 Tax=Streptomyces sp. NPDC093094 TaxID=3366026 RepID=UPI00382204DE
MPGTYSEQPKTFPHNPYDIARVACAALGRDRAPEPPDRILFTLGICEAGTLYLRNDTTGNSTHLPTTTGQTTADLIGRLY